MVTFAVCEKESTLIGIKYSGIFGNNYFGAIWDLLIIFQNIDVYWNIDAACQSSIPFFSMVKILLDPHSPWPVVLMQGRWGMWYTSDTPGPRTEHTKAMPVLAF